MRVNPEELSLKDKVVFINRVAKVVKGGKRFNFCALVVVGDGQGWVGIGKGKAVEVPVAISKAVEHAKKHLVRVPLEGTTIPHPILQNFGAAKVMMRPAAPGAGVIASAGVRHTALRRSDHPQHPPGSAIVVRARLCRWPPPYPIRRHHRSAC